ncbi:MAG: hypothetical protein JSS90_08660 [Bacteroidetes bacterium]|jgi:hypothetical protein|nr:hypothetical protein [Bacteroidota bacterium]
MKKIFAFIAFIAITASAYSQANKTTGSWAELNSFKNILSDFTKASKSGDLKPIKTNIESLINAAVDLYKAEVPAGVDATQMKAATVTLANSCKELYGSISLEQPDTEVKQKLSVVQTAFNDVSKLYSTASKSVTKSKTN